MFTFLGLAGISTLFAFGVLALILIFEIAMFISAVNNKNIPDNIKLLWILGMLLIHPFVAIWYYFTDHKKTS